MPLAKGEHENPCTKPCFSFTDQHVLCSRERVSLGLRLGEIIAAASSPASSFFMTSFGLSHRGQMTACVSLSVRVSSVLFSVGTNAGGLMFPKCVLPVPVRRAPREVS